MARHSSRIAAPDHWTVNVTFVRSCMRVSAFTFSVLPNSALIAEFLHALSQQSVTLWQMLKEIRASPQNDKHHRATQVSTEGDAFTIAFHDPIDAVSWALTMQQVNMLFITVSRTKTASCCSHARLFAEV